jgi:hypothetical protein
MDNYISLELAETFEKSLSAGLCERWRLCRKLYPEQTQAYDKGDTDISAQHSAPL